MKNIYLLLLLFTISLFSQNNEKNWNKVVACENEGKIKSANELVDKIYKKAIQKKDETQIIKCFFYKSKYIQVLQENAQFKILENLKYETKRVSIPSKAILNLVYAKCLADYKERNYSIYNRTKIDSASTGNFLTWTNDDFTKEINTAYEKSLSEETILKNTSLTNYEPIFDFLAFEEFKKLPLFEYILNENIKHYSNFIYQYDINKKEFNEFEVSLIGSASDFIKLDFAFLKNENLKKTLELYQKKESTNPSEENKLQRIKFCASTLLNNNNNSSKKYLVALNSIQKEFKNPITIQDIQLEKAAIYSKLASKEKFPDYNSKAVALLDSIISVNNRSNSCKSALIRKQNIISKSIYISLQKYIYPNENSRLLLNYKNANNITISIYKINQKRLSLFLNNDSKKDSLFSSISKKEPFKKISTNLVNKKDYFNYTTEILLPQLETGSYLIYFETDSYDKIKKAVAYETMTVSNFTILAEEKNKKEYFQVLNRKTGFPIKDVTLNSSLFKLKTNEEGVAIFEIKDEKLNYNQIELSKGNDTLVINKNYYYQNYDYNSDKDDDENPKAKVNFYLDRAIYRPGQTVYYKGIAFQKKQSQKKIVPNVLLSIVIEDADNNELKTFEVTTNEFGSFSGEYTIPKNIMTGEFQISAEEPEDLEKDPLYNKTKDEHPFWDVVDYEEYDSQLRFKVEEYKRPKFEVGFEPIKENYILNQKVNAIGNAKAFSGNSISDAIVKYTITRSVYTIYRNYYDDINDDVLITSETKTDAKGNFNIAFDALPDDSYSSSDLPVYYYRINADVTDINGETHSNETTIKVGYHCLALSVKVPTIFHTKDKADIRVNSTNLNNEPQPVEGELKIYFINKSSKKFKTRVWEKPEIESISDEQFNILFPYERNDKKTINTETGTLVFSKKVNTQKETIFPMDFMSKYESGNYKIVFSAFDKYKNPIETTSQFELIQDDDSYKKSDLFTIEQINKDAKKDGFVTLKITSIEPELYLSVIGNYLSRNFFNDKITLAKNQKIIKIPLNKEFENSVKIGLQCIFENEVFTKEIEVKIKNKISKMQFEVESFRSKIEPGSNENWSFKLKTKNTTNNAEVLASMYDSSLDQFAWKNWQSLDFRESNYNHINFKTSLGFQKTSVYIQNLNSPILNLLRTNEETKLIWFGFDFNSINNSYAAQREYKNQLEKKAKKPLSAKMISGTISDATGPLPGANVMIKGTTRGVQTDLDGYYEIEAAEGETVVYSFIGMFESKLIIGKSKVIDVKLQEDNQKLQEVVVGVLGIRKKKDALTSSTVVVSSRELAENSSENIVQSLAGKVSGLQVTDATGNTRIVLRGSRSITGNNEVLIVIDGVISNANTLQGISPADIVSTTILKGKEGGALYGEQGINGVIIITTQKAIQELTQVKARTNLSETAFFFPQLKTDKKGKISFSFTSPEALTSWKMRLLAHNKNADVGYLEKTIVTQKDLMVVPNFPRFFREKDTIIITSKISNITSESKTGIAVLQLFDATTMQPVDVITLNTNNIKNFNITALGNTTVSWKIFIPEGLQGIQYKVLAKAGNFSDGEENILPVLTNTLLVTESIPIWVRENSKKEYVFENLKDNTSKTLRNHQLTLEYTSNPTWLAIQSLPYLMEYEHECAEQTFARFYANVLATEIINSNSKIAELFETWRKNGRLNSKLEQNEELKSLILSETPWLNDAQNEDEKQQKLALLFDLEKMKNSQDVIFEKLINKQNASGGFVWFDGGIESEYMTRHILAGLGHLKKLNAKAITKEKIDEIAKSGLAYMDSHFLQSHQLRIQNLKDKKPTWLNPYSDLHYLYTRSFYLNDYPLSDNLKNTIKIYLELAKTNWLTYSLYEKGMIALTLNRFNETTTAKKIIESLKETASNNEDWGMYWIENKPGWYWYQAPIEIQALLIEAFSEITNDMKSVDAMKVWLLKNKQSKNWPTTKATTEAVYALLMQGTDWLSVKDNTTIKIGNEKITPRKLSENEKEAETGYMKLTWKKDEINNKMASLSIENKSKVPGFGGFYWQYFEELDKIKSNTKNVMSVAKELYLNKNTENGEELQKITSNNPLKIGDLVTVRLIISTKEDMEYVHLKDMRASCFEPLNIISEYMWNDGLGYYMSTKDTATHFFFDNVNKGTYVLEYDIRVNNIGDFSNGITTIESMYAPEFTSHTKGIRVSIKQ